VADRQALVPLEADPRTGQPLPKDVQERLLESARVTMALIRNFEGYRRRLAQTMGVSVTELRALGRIAEDSSTTPRSLSDQLALTTGSVTALLDRLERAGYIERVRHPYDRRSIQLALTPTGGEALAMAYQAFQARLLGAFESMPPDSVCIVQEFLRLAAGGYEQVDEPFTVPGGDIPSGVAAAAL
jgi:DNA-binding MarR family transcriptional regulator